MSMQLEIMSAERHAENMRGVEVAQNRLVNGRLQQKPGSSPEPTRDERLAALTQVIQQQRVANGKPALPEISNSRGNRGSWFDRRFEADSLTGYLHNLAVEHVYGPQPTSRTRRNQEAVFARVVDRLGQNAGRFRASAPVRPGATSIETSAARGTATVPARATASVVEPTPTRSTGIPEPEIRVRLLSTPKSKFGREKTHQWKLNYSKYAK
jgi:hypothetical protein